MAEKKSLLKSGGLLAVIVVILCLFVVLSISNEVLADYPDYDYDYPDYEEIQQEAREDTLATQSICLVVGFPIAILCGAVVYSDAKKYKGTSAGLWGLVGFFFGIFGVIIWFIARISKEKKDYTLKTDEQIITDEKIVKTEERPCPQCGQQIPTDAIICPYCMSSLTNTCPSCGKKVESSWKACPYCGQSLADTGSRYRI